MAKRARGGRTSLRMSHARPAAMHRGSAVRLNSKLGSVAAFGRGGGHGPSIKKPDTYEALRRKGYSKAKAARISNAQANGTIDHKGGRKRRGPNTK